jgi:DNA-binding NarL/FixJ family response regulator
MATENPGTPDARQKLRAALEANRHLALKGRALAGELGEAFAALKDAKARHRRQAASSAPPLLPHAVPPADHKRTIMLMEDHPIVSLGISEVINYETDLTVCGIAEDRVSALDKLSTLHPELVLLDLTLKERSGLELLKDIKARFPRQRVLILSLHDENVYAARALRAGACGYVMKDQATDTLLEAIRKVLDGGTYLSPAMAAAMEAKAHDTALPNPPIVDKLGSLTDRELEVLRLIGEAKTTRSIADLLCISLKTVESHRTNIKHKLALHTATQLVQFAFELSASGSAA